MDNVVPFGLSYIEAPAHYVIKQAEVSMREIEQMRLRAKRSVHEGFNKAMRQSESFSALHRIAFWLKHKRTFTEAAEEALSHAEEDASQLGRTSYEHCHSLKQMAQYLVDNHPDKENALVHLTINDWRSLH
jgi:hypothetical protein